MAMIKTISVLVFVLISIAGCSDSGTGNVIKVAVSPNSPPMLYAENGVVKHLFVEAPGEFKVSSAEAVLAAL